MAQQIKLGGKTYLLRMTMAGARLAQELSKKGLGSLVHGTFQMDLDVMPVMFYCCTRAEHPELTFDEVKQMFEARPVLNIDVAAAVSGALGEFLDPEAAAATASKKSPRGSKGNGSTSASSAPTAINT